MDPLLQQLVRQLHQAPCQSVLALTGGGARALAWLLSVPGGSRTVLEAVVPYGERALTEFLGQAPEHFCSAATGEAMARRAYERAAWLAPDQPVAGVGCTASLATDRPKRGEHRCHVTARTADRVTTCSLVLTKGARDRDGEEEVVARVVLNALAEAFQVAGRVEPGLLPGEALEASVTHPPVAVLALMRGELPAVCCEADGRCHAAAGRPAVLLPGAFNPVHEGHHGLGAVASRLTGQAAAFELSVTNVDKPPLSLETVRQRLAQFAWRGPVWLTRAPTFVEKAELFPGAVFVVGADTAERIVAPRYYGDSPARMEEALERIRARGCRFLVAARADPSGKVLTLGDIALPAGYRALFQDVPVAEFCTPVSSTAIREQASFRVR